MSFDPNAHREASLRSWEEAASGWARQQAAMREFGAPVSHWMIDAISPQPGERVLELAAGLGETGMLAAELVAPMGGRDRSPTRPRRCSPAPASGRSR